MGREIVSGQEPILRPRFTATSAVKIYKTTNGLVRHENKNIFFYFLKKRSSLHSVSLEELAPGVDVMITIFCDFSQFWHFSQAPML
jgi:hypothetical protein